MPIRKSVTSKDGTTISYQEFSSSNSYPVSINHGEIYCRSLPLQETVPGLIILHGGLKTSQSNRELAEKLCQAASVNCKVFIPDRRGREFSGPHGADYSIQKEVEDLEAILRETGARSVLGISGGAMVALAAGLILTTARGVLPRDAELLNKLIVFEPHLFFDNFHAWEQGRLRFDAEIAAGDTAAALITALRMTQIGPILLRVLPRWLTKPVVRLGGSRAMQRQQKMRETAARDDESMHPFTTTDSTKAGIEKSSDDKMDDGDVDGLVTVWQLAPTLHYDNQLILDIHNRLQNQELRELKDRNIAILLTNAPYSPPYLRKSVDILEDMLNGMPDLKRVQLPEGDHSVFENKAAGGMPDLVVPLLKEFLAW